MQVSQRMQPPHIELKRLASYLALAATLRGERPTPSSSNSTCWWLAMAAASEAPLSARLRLSPFLGLQPPTRVKHALLCGALAVPALQKEGLGRNQMIQMQAIIKEG